MKEFRLGLSIAMGIFLGLSAWSLAFPRQSIPMLQRAGYQMAAFDGCGSYNNPCEISGKVQVEMPNQPVTVTPFSPTGFSIEIMR